MAAARSERAPAKVNLTLRVIGRRSDGYHDLESLVVFADIGDTLAFAPGRVLSLRVAGPTAAAAGTTSENLVLKAARALGDRVEGLQLGRFDLAKRLPVAAGLGGGSADAAAALRLLASANRLALDDPRVIAAARATGADVPVCLDPRPRVMRGIGDVLSDPLALPKLPAVLVNPGVAVPTAQIFGALKLQRSKPLPSSDVGRLCAPLRIDELIEVLRADRNDLEAPAISFQPVIAEVLRDLQMLPNCRLARMSGSGATCFAAFATVHAAAAAARVLRARRPRWWIRTTRLG